MSSTLQLSQLSQLTDFNEFTKMTMTDYKPSAKDVQELRLRTGAGMMDCRNALTAANGDINLAIENLRKSGIAKAEKRAGRVASEGRIVVNMAPDAKTGSILELNSETDFVSRNDDFGAVAESAASSVRRRWPKASPRTSSTRSSKDRSGNSSPRSRSSSSPGCATSRRQSSSSSTMRRRRPVLR